MCSNTNSYTHCDPCALKEWLKINCLDSRPIVLSCHQGNCGWEFKYKVNLFQCCLYTVGISYPSLFSFVNPSLGKCQNLKIDQFNSHMLSSNCLWKQPRFPMMLLCFSLGRRHEKGVAPLSKARPLNLVEDLTIIWMPDAFHLPTECGHNEPHEYSSTRCASVSSIKE